MSRPRLSGCLLLLMVLHVRADVAAAAPCALHVPAGSSLRAARDFVAATLAASRGHLDDDLVVCLGAGRHDVSEHPFELGVAHSARSGGGRVVWRAAPGGGAAIFSGGAQVTGWAATTLGGGAVFSAPVPPVVAAAGTVVRQLWVAGARASRTVLTSPAAALGGMALWTSGDAVGYTTGTVPAAWLSNGTRSIELTYPIVITNWIAPRCTVASISVAPPAPPHNITGPFAGTSTVSHSGVAPGASVPGQVLYAGTFPTVDGCIAACVAASACTAYTWHDATCGSGFATMCYFRIDGEWAPETGWPGHFSGDKGGGGGGANITLASPCGAYLVAKGRAAPATIEAAPMFPLTPGTFWHDPQAAVLYYALASTQSASDLAGDAWTAAQDVLLDVTNVSGHVFGPELEFVYGSWGQANTGDGFVDLQAAVYSCTPVGGSAEPRGNIRVSGGSGVVFASCVFHHLAAAYALSIMEGCQGPVVMDSNFSDLSGGFLKLGSVGTQASGSDDPANWDSYAVIVRNTAADMALEYDGACGFFGGYLFSADVSHNSVSDAGYSGFSQGWGWGSVFPQGVGNNTISFNRIENVMRLLRDGGGIYVNGAENVSWPSSMHDNYVNHDQAVFAVYYLDNGASRWWVYNNVCENSPAAWAFFMSGGAGLPAKNNRMERLWYAKATVQGPRNDCAQWNCTVDDATIVAVTGAWPPQAQAIIDASGAAPKAAQRVRHGA